MSRIGKKPIQVPKQVNVSVADREVRVEAGGRSLRYEHRPEVRVRWDEGDRLLRVEVDEALAGDRQARAYWGLTRSLLSNMVEGVVKGYEKTLEIVGVGWGAEVKGQTLELKVGYANPVVLPIPAGLEVSVDRQFVRIRGADKQLVGQFAAQVRAVRKPEPYNGKGIKYTDEIIRRKQGKAFG